MQDFNINHLRKDINFMEEAITVSNASKKKSFELNENTRVPKKVKNLRYFLKKKRNIIYKHSPSQLFSRSVLNTTTFESNNKAILWTVELIFI